MNNIINYENLHQFAYSSDKLISGDIKGIVLYFGGLGSQGMYGEPSYEAERLAKLGIVYVIPYYNPWAWMNKCTIEFVDKIIDIIIEKYIWRK